MANPDPASPPLFTPPVRILSLDGGGVRGLSSILILKHIMERINDKFGNEIRIEPWQVFDMIGGTSTGGIIAVMLGRLRMSLVECEQAYLSLSQKIFTPKRSALNFHGRGMDFLQANGRFDAQVLEAAMKENIIKVTNEDALLKDPESCCKVFVVTTREHNTGTALLRSYKNPKRPGVLYEECEIWQACRATSAATTFFDPIQIGSYKQRWIDGGVGCNNPVQEAHNEAQNIWPSRDTFILSIGTGSAPGKAFGGEIRETKTMVKIVESMKVIVTETEKTSEMFFRTHDTLADNDLLFRFNVTQGLKEIGLEEYKETEAIATATETYLEQYDVGRKLTSCVDKLSTLILADISSPAHVRPVASSVSVLSLFNQHEMFTEIDTRVLPSSNLNQSQPQPRFGYTAQYHCQPTQINMSAGLQFASASSLRLPQLSPRIGSAASSPTSSLPSLERVPSTLEWSEFNTNFLDKVIRGEEADTQTILFWMKNADHRIRLNKKSLSTALIILLRYEHSGKQVKYTGKWHEVIEVLLGCSPDLDYRDSQVYFTPLIWAVWQKQEWAVSVLIRAGASQEAVDGDFRRTPLMWAAKRNARRVAQILIENMKDPMRINATDKDGKTALAIADTGNHIETANLLRAHGAELRGNVGSPMQPAELAAE